MHKQIAEDLAKSVYQVAESVRAGQVSQRRRLNREAFRRYIQEQAEPVECPENASVAPANKLVRICWAEWCHERHFSGDWRSSKPA